jgi:hypothetical protein
VQVKRRLELRRRKGCCRANGCTGRFACQLDGRKSVCCRKWLPLDLHSNSNRVGSHKMAICVVAMAAKWPENKSNDQVDM